MNNIEEKAKRSARWSIELMEAGFSVHKTIDKIILAEKHIRAVMERCDNKKGIFFSKIVIDELIRLKDD